MGVRQLNFAVFVSKIERDMLAGTEEWDTGLWHQYLERECINQQPLLRDGFEERFRVPHDVFCEFEDEVP